MGIQSAKDSQKSQQGEIMKRKVTSLLAIMTMLSFSPTLIALEKEVDVYLLDDSATHQGVGKKIGTLTLKDSDKGLVIMPHLKDLPKGEHGFHIHQNPSCEGGEENSQWIKGLAAGGHYDPERSNKHMGPFNEGHRGDLPVLVINEKGESQREVIAPRLKLANVLDRSVVIHAGGDNYTDTPPLGGGGDRIACGVIK